MATLHLPALLERFRHHTVDHPAGFAFRLLRIVKRTAQAFFEDDVTRLGAALAFYTTIAVAPIMVLSVAVAGMFLESSDARDTVVREIRDLVGEPAAQAVATLPSPAMERGGVVATTLGGVTLLFGALGVFRHLQSALNSIWRTRPPNLDLWKLIRYRITSLAVVVATGFLLLVSLILSSVLNWLATRMMNRLDLPVLYFEMINIILSFGLITVLFALVFKLLPDTRVPWRHVWLGAGVTAVLFTLGKSALGLYLAHARITSAYGAAGSLVALLVWSYYASQIVFLGAEFTRVTTLSNGGRDFSPLDQPLERVRLSHLPDEPLNVKNGQSRPPPVSARRPGRG